MRTCQSCGLQNPDDRDFCECGEYLRWDPTGLVQAVSASGIAVLAVLSVHGRPGRLARHEQLAVGIALIGNFTGSNGATIKAARRVIGSGAHRKICDAGSVPAD